MQINTQELKNFEFGNATDTGCVRQNNEDYLGYFQTQNGHLFVVCDGMGGHKAGEKASQLSVEVFKNFFSESYYHSPQEALYEAAKKANQVVYETAQKFSDFAGMGTTLVAALIRDNAVFYVHIGDSRLYYYEQNSQTLHRITKDHSFVQELVDKGIITDAEAELHPRKNEIKRAVGIHPEVEPEVGTYPIQPADNDLMLLCSDGLNSMISDQQIREIITDSSLKIMQKTQKLVEAAKNAGGHDNITVQLIRFYAQNRKKAVLPIEKTKATQTEQTPTQKYKKNFTYYIFGGALLVALLVGYGISTYFTNNKQNSDAKKDTTTKVEKMEEKISPPVEIKKDDSSQKKSIEEKKEPNTSKTKDKTNETTKEDKKRL
ncbi:MAG: Stp1/IreP family PP2C-type Ser/Thr phosphatase [Raineya sp.]